MLELVLVFLGALLVAMAFAVYYLVSEKHWLHITWPVFAIVGGFLIIWFLAIPAFKCGFFDIRNMLNPEAWNTENWGPADWVDAGGPVVFIILFVISLIIADREQNEKPFAVVLVAFVVFIFFDTLPAIRTVDMWMVENEWVKAPVCQLHIPVEKPVQTAEPPVVAVVPPQPSPSITPTATFTSTPVPTQTPFIIEHVVTVTVSIEVPSATAKNNPCKIPSGIKAFYAPLVLPHVSEENSQKVPIVFAEGRTEVVLRGNIYFWVCLSSTEDGKGNPKADDLLQMIVRHEDGSEATLNFNFNSYDNDKSFIQEWPAQDVSQLFSAGKNQVLIRIWDTKTPKRSVSDVYLVFYYSVP